MKKDVVCGTLLIAVVAVFWAQRDGSGKITASFPDVVLVILAVLGVGIIARGVIRGDRNAQVREIDLRFLASSVAVLLVWAVGMGLVGFTISSVVMFVTIAQLIRRQRPKPQVIVKDTVVGTLIVVGCFFVFTRVLLVPLPVSVLIGM